MPRISYLPEDFSEPCDTVDAIRTRRGGTLLNLDKILLYSVPFAKGWNAFLGQVRTGLSLSPKLRELVICVVASLNGADYEFHHHAPEFLKAGGSLSEVDALRKPEDCLKESFGFNELERAAIRLTIAMTRTVHVDGSLIGEVRHQLASDRQLVELVGVIAAYNMVSRFLTAFAIEPE